MAGVALGGEDLREAVIALDARDVHVGLLLVSGDRSWSCHV